MTFMPKWREFVFRDAYPFDVVEIIAGKGWASQEDYSRDVADFPLVAYVDCEFRFDSPVILIGCVAMVGCRLYEPPRFLMTLPPIETFVTDCYYGRDIVHAIKYGATPSAATS